MANRLFEAALQNRLLTIILVLVIVGLGARALVSLPIDAVPDVTPNVVQVVTDAQGLGPAEVEKFITFPVEIAMRGMPGITEIRSLSRFGLSSVWIYFEEKYDIYFARRLVMERLPAARELIPKGYGSPEMTPVSTALGEIYQFEVVDPNRSLMDLRSILNWQIAPRLKAVPGVVEVNSFGGELRTFELQLDPSSLVAYGLSLSDVFRALEKNNASAGGGYIVRSGEQEVIRGTGLIQNLADVGNIVVGNRTGVPIYAKNLGKVAFAPRIRQGAVTHDGKGETVVGVVMMLIGENSRTVVERVKAKIKEIQPTLPEGVKIEPFYDRADLIKRTIETVSHNLVEGAILVVVVLFLFLGDIRASLIVASVIPLSMLVAFMGMKWSGVSGNLMSLGAIDFGLIVDGSVVMIENIFRRLATSDPRGHSMSHRIFEAGREVLRPIVFAIGIIIIVYLPILTFENVEGKMFRPMALTVIFALCGSLLCALTFVPVMASLLLKKVPAHEPYIARMFDRWHANAAGWIGPRPQIALGASLVLLIVGFAWGPFLGSEFIPTLNEGTINVDVLRVPSISLGAAAKDATRAEKALLELPEVTRVVSRIGRPELATDTAGPDESDVYVFLKPPEEWRMTGREALIKELERKLKERVPETRYSFSQPIENRVNDMIAGIKADVALHVYGDDFGKMLGFGKKLLKILSEIPGSADGKVAPREGLPSLNIEINRAEVARYGINVSDVLDAVETIGGKIVGQVVEGDARYLLQVRFAKASRENLEQLDDIMVAAPDGKLIPLAQLARFTVEEGPVSIWRENLTRRVTVAVNVRGTDLGSFVAKAKAAVGEQAELPRGWWLEWGGQYENLQRASKRLMLLVPVSLLLIVILLYNTFNSMRTALLIFGNVLLGACGGIIALGLRGLTFSITAGVGFITLFGVSVLNGVVLVSEINRLREMGTPVDEAIAQASRERLRPILMASMVALFGFIPMAISRGAGAEVQSPLATVVIGGLITSTPFTLYVLPLIYRWLIPDTGDGTVQVKVPEAAAAD
ncbi:MAG: CusA/CzcA family heavy metal efflux RND transporter [Candidatus Binatus sp.]|uniref:efflux RND transporter permease subunit n=1 Tax=Candidatus Binatus sp. TaxID=2811406 RepID=UPI00271D9F27|nr:CusA/CzcA family heavy metal efflux RND transporter [Candidatus Binatus sp.]MDO8431427.1 CusA/CzcA family heavy metal efflux RND transporter [Candidatus Binatus sp.]